MAKQMGRAYLAALTPMVEAIDRRLRDRLQVIEYSNSPDCVFRLQIINCEGDLQLDDGTRLRRGDRVIDLHLWNEQIPRMPDGAPTLAFARRIERCVELSLSELAKFLAARRDLDDIRAIRGNMSLGAQHRSDQSARIAARYGFERVSQLEPPSFARTLHRLGENVLVTMLALARNPGSVRGDTLWRDRTLTYLSRRTLENRYAG
ncbi:hypothetical protein OGR47_05375 [Methylocystis sp. MJC1]|jgi:hypothetical protein|uniref:YkoP family protein n=1 Tax=Methylocystis sp. MJC1 TaxID=2654282 RepID=UPI0013EB96D3|nr:hypothetical protein [Methylocystis sp. MJC1]MBU6526434.1 hypothetical protein [Methylocystis sp. MJC1]UZX12876.1 hypothetical protein OGR47_05375 [Methylocystis sp. MJC1]